MLTASQTVSLGFRISQERIIPTATLPRNATPEGRSRSLAQDVVATLSAQIREGKFQPGDKLPTEAQIMKSHGVSRSVVREALSRLQAAGIAATRHGIGTFVLEHDANPHLWIAPSARITLREIVAALEVRISLETEAAALAAARRTDTDLTGMRLTLADMEAGITQQRDTAILDIQFHRQIAMATHNHYFTNMFDHLGNVVMPRARLDTASITRHDATQYVRDISYEHASIYGAIERRDAQTAAAAMRLHLGTSLERLRRAESEAAATG